MKKLRIAELLIILAFSFSVKAKVLLKINCDSNIITDDKLITCAGKLSYDQEGINDIEFNYQTNLDVNFVSLNGFTIEKENNKVLIHSKKTLFDMITTSIKIMEFNLSSNNMVSDTEDFVINNIIINKSNDIIVNDIVKTFNISKTVELDDICTLDSISVDGNVVKDFSKEKLEYFLTTENDIVFIDGVRTSNKSNVIGFGNVMVSPGETIERDIHVIAENKKENIYKLFITNTKVLEEKEKDKEEEVKSKDNTLKTLELYKDNNKIKFDFDNTKEIYNIDILDTKVITIKAKLNNDKAKFVKDYGPRDIELNNGYNKILIKILVENGDEKVITLNVNYQESISDNNELETLIINDKEIDLNNELEIVLPNEIDKTRIEAVPKDDKSIVKYEDIDLLVGNNKIIIEVISVSGKSKIYEVNVIREDKEIILADIPVKENIIINEDNHVIKLVCYSIFIVGITAFISSIIYFYKKKKAL